MYDMDSSRHPSAAPLTCTTAGKRREEGARVEAMSAERVFTTVLFYLIMRFSKYIQNCSLKLKSCGGDNSKAPISLNLSRLENSVNLLWRRISTHSIQSAENHGVFPVVWKVPTGLYVQNWRGSINTDVTIVIEQLDDDQHLLLLIRTNENTITTFAPARGKHGIYIFQSVNVGSCKHISVSKNQLWKIRGWKVMSQRIVW